MVPRAGGLQEERFAKSRLQREHAYGTIFGDANTCSPVRIIKLNSVGAEG